MRSSAALQSEIQTFDLDGVLAGGQCRHPEMSGVVGDTVRTTPVSSLRAVTVTPGSAALEPSTTEPCRIAVPAVRPLEAMSNSSANTTGQAMGRGTQSSYVLLLADRLSQYAGIRLRQTVGPGTHGRIPPTGKNALARVSSSSPARDFALTDRNAGVHCHR